MQRVLEMILDLSLGMMSVEGQGYPKVTKLGLGAIDTTPLRGDERVPPSSSG